MAEPKLAELPPPEDLADVIRKIGDGFDRLLKSGLNQHAIVTLLAHETKVPRRQINEVLNGLRDLAKQYTSPKK